MKKLKVFFLDYNSHWAIAIEPIYEALLTRGHDAVMYHPRKSLRKLEEADILFQTSNARRPKSGKQTKTFFLPHGIGAEYDGEIEVVE